MMSAVPLVTRPLRNCSGARATGCSGHPAFPAPSRCRKGELDAKLGRMPSRECGGVSFAPSLAIQVSPSDPLWHCGCWPFSFRRLLRSGRWQPSVNRFGRRFRGSKGSGNADSQRNDGNRRAGGLGRTRHDSGCVPAHPPSWAPSYLPLRADWAHAPGRSGVFEDKRTLQRPSQSARTTQKEF